MAKQTGLSASETASFCAQMGRILAAGISAEEGLQLMAEEAEKEEGAILRGMLESLQRGDSFGAALQEAGVFPAYMVKMLQLAETTGCMDEVLDSLGRHYRGEAETLRSIKGAVLYPLVMILMMLAVLVLLLTRVMPVFEQVFRQLGSEMSGVSLALLQLGNALRGSAWGFGAAAALLLTALCFFTLTAKGRAGAAALLQRMDRKNGYFRRLSLCRFADGLAILLSGGLSPEESLKQAAELVDSPALKQKLQLCLQQVQEGSSLSAALAAQGVFSGTYARMALLGERTGSLDGVMSEIAQRYREELEQRLTGRIGAIEPVLVIVLSVAVGLILLSVMLPLMSALAGM